MKLVDHCPNFCLSSRPEVNDKWTGSGGNSQKNRFWKKFLDVFNCKSQLGDNCEPSARSFHRSATSNVHKCLIERKFKIKKRELFNRHRRELFVVDDDYNKSRSGKSNKLWKKELEKLIVVLENWRVQRWESLVNFPVKRFTSPSRLSSSSAFWSIEFIIQTIIRPLQTSDLNLQFQFFIWRS